VTSKAVSQVAMGVRLRHLSKKAHLVATGVRHLPKTAHLAMGVRPKNASSRLDNCYVNFGATSDLQFLSRRLDATKEVFLYFLETVFRYLVQERLIKKKITWRREDLVVLFISAGLTGKCHHTISSPGLNLHNPFPIPPRVRTALVTFSHLVILDRIRRNDYSRFWQMGMG